MIYLVRHAQPMVRRKVAPDRWQLTADGRSAAARLAGRLPWDPYLVASGEPKAIQTLQCAYPGRAVDVDPRFGEVRRAEPVDDGYAERRRRYVSGLLLPGWELASAVAARFAAAVTDHLGRADGRPLVIGTHGMALTVWLAALLPAALTAGPAEFWAALALPDVLAVDPSTATVVRQEG
ncbi:hypothetical protein Athai_54550 [Actinocatenispora thailandica]|uniref:Histidine phosphatase family protein n=1 Tax=Actinocatenispora thailandica TaxID=227318 RepID=A0A7R7DV89_9ACTN|nr:histidine phosphatase family protein [Actinocatenispora thailandica]BCJ37952.1 hypothetical protein Athai_54550 [Actinocatenispora thailandica]